MANFLVRRNTQGFEYRKATGDGTDADPFVFANSIVDDNGVSIDVATETKQDAIIENQTDGTQKIQITDANGRVIELDHDTSAMPTITAEHNKIHQGKHFYIDTFVEIPINNVYDIQITTPANTVEQHFTFEISVESETQLFVYKNVTILTGGTALTIYNNNHRSANVSGLVIKGIANSSVVNANLDTATAGATIQRMNMVGAGKNAGVISRQNEVILASGEDYCIRFIANTAGYVNFHLKWYEV